MTGRQQFARLLPLAALILLAVVGLRGAVATPRWDGPLKTYGVAIGIALEVVLGILLLINYRRERQALREQDALSRTAVPGAAGAGDDGAGDERDVPASLRFLLRMVLGAAMIAVAIVVLVALHLHLFSGKAPARTAPAPVRIAPRMSVPPPPAGAGAPFRFPLEAVLYALLVLALLAALAAGIWWARRLGRPAVPARPGSLAEDSADLREAVASGRAAMRDLDDARAAIIACYLAMEGSLADRGAARAVADTPDELLARAIAARLVRGGAAGRLTGLFYEARYSSHPLGTAERAAAVSALDELAAELGADPVAPAAEAGA